MSLLNEFKQFILRGSVVDLAVAVVIGAAFGKIVSSLVNDIIMPLIGLLLGGIDISDKSFTIGHAVLKWGMFLQTIIDFTIIAFSIFMAIKLLSLLYKKHAEPSKKTNEEILLTEIRDLLKQTNTKQT